MKNDIEKLGAMIVGGEDEERFWVLVDKVIEHRSKINELLEITDERTQARDEQIKNIHAEIKDLKRELMEYHNLLLKHKVLMTEFNKYLLDIQKLYKTLSEQVVKINKKLEID